MLALTLLEQLLAPIIAAVGTIVATLIMLGYRKVIAYFGLKAKVEEEKIVEAAINRSVQHTMQTFVKDLKEKSADGKLTKEEALEALGRAKKEALTQLKDLAGNATAELLIANTDALTARIEAAIFGSK